MRGFSIGKTLGNAGRAGALICCTTTLLANDDTAMTEVRVWGEHRSSPQASYTNPTSILTRKDFAGINTATTEDLVKYEPSLVIRRRFIGDANGTLGLRGSSMFQTSRSMVIADGVPLHYFLESRWNGAPRWTLVSASEIARTEVIYGPFSAEYSGNAMGGVVVIETAIPREREFHLDGSLFNQSFDEYGFNDNVAGYKGFASYGDRFGNLSVYLSYNHLQNASQPQSFYYGAASGNGDPLPVSGGIAGNDERGNNRLYFGDTGVVDTITDNLKLKIGYEFDNWETLFNLAYEDRLSRQDSPNSYLRDGSGNPVWGGAIIQNGTVVEAPERRLTISEQDRDSLSLGWRLRGDVSEAVAVETNFSRFRILNDETRTSAFNPAHPDYTPAGQIQDYGDTGWDTAEIKLRITLPWQEMELITGLRHESYQLNKHIYDSENYAAGIKSALTGSSGGETQIQAGFSQLNWEISRRWSLAIGGRYESWKSDNGYYSEDLAATGQLGLIAVPGRSRSTFSPKFSLGFYPDDQWSLRYSIAKAYRFPIVEELFSQYQAYNAASEANPNLNPEDGIHHNLMIERAIDNGYIRINLYRENIKDVIEAQSTTLPGGISIFTFVPVDEVETRGAEFIVNSDGVIHENLSVRFNLAWTDAEIIDNSADPSIVGNSFPRMPKWRGNILANWRVTDRLDIGGNLQYAGDSYGRLDNSDHEDQVYGAQDGYARIGLKAGYQYGDHTRIDVGVDNLTDEIAYVSHPWPGRTFYLGFSYDY